MNKINVTIWNEYVHEQAQSPAGEYIRKIYPKGIHRYLAEALAADDLEITPVSLDQPEQGLPDELQCPLLRNLHIFHVFQSSRYKAHNGLFLCQTHNLSIVHSSVFPKLYILFPESRFNQFEKNNQPRIIHRLSEYLICNLLHPYRRHQHTEHSETIDICTEAITKSLINH